VGHASAAGATLRNSSATGDVTFNNTGRQPSSVGGLVGRADSWISGSFSKGPVTVNHSGTAGDVFAGGLVGNSNSSGGTIEQSYAALGADVNVTITAITGAGNVNVGGLVGRMNGHIVFSWTGNNVKVSNSAAGGNNIVNRIGGIVGYSEARRVNDTYALGNIVVSGTTRFHVGGIMGQGNANNAMVIDSFFRGIINVTGAAPISMPEFDVAGIVGVFSAPGASTQLQRNVVLGEIHTSAAHQAHNQINRVFGGRFSNNGQFSNNRAMLNMWVGTAINPNKNSAGPHLQQGQDVTVGELRDAAFWQNAPLQFTTARGWNTSLVGTFGFPFLIGVGEEEQAAAREGKGL
jgi:hypothetical protein